MSDALLVVSRMFAAKSIDKQLGVALTELQENSGGPQLLAHAAPQPPHAAAPALPLQGNLRPDALLPVVVQPRLIPGAVYTPPYVGAAHGRSNPVQESFLRGRGGA